MALCLGRCHSAALRLLKKQRRVLAWTANAARQAGLPDTRQIIFKGPGPGVQLRDSLICSIGIAGDENGHLSSRRGSPQTLPALRGTIAMAHTHKALFIATTLLIACETYPCTFRTCMHPELMWQLSQSPSYCRRSIRMSACALQCIHPCPASAEECCRY